MILSIHSTFVSIAKKVPAVLKLFNTFVMRENKGKCFLPLAQKYFFGFTHHKAQQKIIIQRHTKFFYITHLKIIQGSLQKCSMVFFHDLISNFVTNLKNDIIQRLVYLPNNS